MNGKKAKQLRNIARAMVGKKVTSYIDARVGVKQCGVTQNSMGMQVPYMVATYQRRLKPGTTREVYQSLK